MPEVIRETVVTRNPNVVVTKQEVEDSPTQTVSYLIYFIFGVIELLLVFRFILKLTGANPGSGFVSFIYGVSQLFVAPFRGIFPNAATDGAVVTAVLEPASLVGIVVYAALAWGIVSLVLILTRKSQEPV